VSEDFGIEKFRTQPLETLARLADRETAERLRGAVDPKSVCAVTGISFGASASPNECCIGDALRMIQPFTGNGMSIAVESAFAAAEPLAQFSAGARSWKETLREVNRATGKLFRSRFAVAGVLQKVANRSWTRGVMLSALRTFQPLLPLCFQATR
jgi:flavin-dependent dehydrogenase